METISYRIEIPDPYQNAYERVTMELNHRLQTREMEGIEAALKEYGYVKVRTCEIVELAQPFRADLDAFDTWWNFSCGHRTLGTYWEQPRYCPVCGAKVTDDSRCWIECGCDPCDKYPCAKVVE